MVVLVGDTANDPFVDLAPVHAPAVVAAQELAYIDDHVRVVLWPVVITLGLDPIVATALTVPPPLGDDWVTVEVRKEGVVDIFPDVSYVHMR